MDFQDTNGSPNPSQKTRPRINKKINCHQVISVVPVDHRMEIKESERKLLSWEKLCNMRVTVIPVIIGGLETVSMGLEIKRKIVTIQTTALNRQEYWSLET